MNDPHINVNIKVCGTKSRRGKLQCVGRANVLVDSGATHSMIPRGMLDAVGIASSGQMNASLADGKSVEYQTAKARVCMMGDGPDAGKGVCANVIVGVVDGEHIATVGASTLHALKVKMEFGARRSIVGSGEVIESDRKR